MAKHRKETEMNIRLDWVLIAVVAISTIVLAALFAGKKNDDLESLAISVLGDKYEDVSE